MVTRDIIQRLLNVINDTRQRVNTLESREYVLLTATQTLTNKTLTTPTIGDFTNATHDHTNAAGGGQLSLTTAVSGVLPAANGGTGVNNATRTLTINTNSGTLAFSGAGFTLTIPKTGTVPVGTGTAGRIAEWVTDANTVQASTLAKTGAGVLTLSAAGAYTLTIPATGTAALLGTANVFTANQTINGNLVVDTDTLFVDSVNNSVGVGTASPIAKLEVVSDTAAALRFERTAGHINVFRIDITQALGTSANSTTFRHDTNNGDFAWRATNTGNAQMILKATGNVGIGTTSPSAQLHIDQPSSTAAKPTLRLRQADLSEEFIRFDATVGAGNPINTTALGAYYGRVRVWVEGVGEKWLALYNT